ncbi:MAG: hypothetical protein SNF93_02300 [Rikenellaceae bacterium]
MIYLFATEFEAQPFRKAYPDAQIVICGVGAAECAATTAQIITQMCERGEQKTLILAGIAGSYDLSQVALCEVVEVLSEQIAALPERFAKHYLAASQTTLKGVSSNSVNSSAECPPTAQIENMEGAAFMAVCERLNVKCLQVRAISNKVGDPFAEWKVAEACAALCDVLLDLSLTASLTGSGGRG